MYSRYTVTRTQDCLYKECLYKYSAEYFVYVQYTHTKTYPIDEVEDFGEATDERERRVELEEEYVAQHRAARVERNGELLDEFGGQAAVLGAFGQLRVDGAHELALLVDLFA